MKRMIGATVAVAVLVSLSPVAASRFENAERLPQPVLKAPMAVNGWEPVTARFTAWAPHFVNAPARVQEDYWNSGNRKRTGLFIAYYNNQRPGVQLITAMNGLVSGEDREWRKISEAQRMLIASDNAIPSIESQLQGLSQRLLVWHWYWVDGKYTANAYWAKLLQAKSRLLGRGDDGAVIVIYTAVDDDTKAAAATLQSFVTAALPAIRRTVDHAR